MFVDLGHTVKRIAEKTPGGILMFFPSYKLMETCYGLWCDDGVGKQIDQVKTLLREPKKADQFQNIMDRYYACIFGEGGQGAIMMGVCRGRISEGLDFSDDAARCVIIVGIPYP